MPKNGNEEDRQQPRHRRRRLAPARHEDQRRDDDHHLDQEAQQPGEVGAEYTVHEDPIVGAGATIPRDDGANGPRLADFASADREASTELEAVATTLPAASVTTPSAKATRLPGLVTVPTAVSGPLLWSTGRR